MARSAGASWTEAVRMVMEAGDEGAADIGAAGEGEADTEAVGTGETCECESVSKSEVKADMGYVPFLITYIRVVAGILFYFIIALILGIFYW